MKDKSESQKTNRFWCVENFSLVEVLDRQEQEALHHYMRFVDYRAGETIYFPGDPSDTVYSLHRGRVRLGYLNENGRRLTFAILGKGQVFGETALAGEETRHWIAEALEDSTLCMIFKGDLLRFAEGNPKLALRISKLVGERLVEIENKLQDLIFKGVPARLSQTLLELAERYGEREAEGVRIRFKITHRELAQLIGSTRETTSVALGRMERQGLLSKRYGVIVLKNLERLKEAG